MNSDSDSPHPIADVGRLVQVTPSARAAHAGVPAVRVRANHGTSDARIGVTFLIVFLVLIMGMLAAGAFYARNYDRQYRARVEQQLSAIADLKVSELVQWRRERLGDGTILFRNAAFSGMVRRFLENRHDIATQEDIRTWLNAIYASSHQYDQLRLLATDGTPLLAAATNQLPVSASVLQCIPEVLRSGQVTLVDFHRHSSDQKVYLTLMIPVLDEADAHRPLGVVTMRIDPQTYVYPYIQRWPTPSSSAETLLVRREGNEAVFLNELRFQTNAALNLRFPLDRLTMPGVRAALGENCFMEGLDYRGDAVLAAVRTIPGTPWALVARMDTAEAFGPLRRELWKIFGLTAALLFGMGSCAGLFWRHENIRQLKGRVEAADELRASETRYRRLFEAARDGILILDAKTGMVVDVNPYLVELLGVSREVFLGKKVWELGFFKDLVANEANFVELQQKGYVRYEDMALEGYDGKRHEVEFVSNVYLADNLKVIQCNIRDISDRKRMELVLLQTNAELQQRNEELERFLYSASHDLKSPVVTVRTFLGYLEQDMAAGDAGKIAKDLNFICTAADKMALLLDDVLEIARVGRVTNPPVQVTLRNLMDDALAAVAGRIAERGVTVQVNDDEVALHGDRIRLAEVFQNLLENACKFMGDQKTPRIEIGVEQRESGPVFFVRDNGIGIDPRHQSKLFNLFEKLDPKVEGTGIGLALVKRIVELNRGRIWVESAGVGQGACFCFTLPGALGGGGGGQKP